MLKYCKISYEIPWLKPWPNTSSLTETSITVTRLGLLTWLCKHECLWAKDSRGLDTDRHQHCSADQKQTQAPHCGSPRFPDASARTNPINKYDNTYFFSNRTTEKTVSAIQACAGGRFSMVSTLFVNTDNLEVRLTPTKSKRNIANSWRIVWSCPDTGSEVCIISRPHIRM